MENIPKLIHIGLPKTGSTALQSYWSEHSNIQCCWQNMAEMVSQVRQAIAQNKDYDDLSSLKPLNFDQKRESAICNIYSSEALSTYTGGSQPALKM